MKIIFKLFFAVICCTVLILNPVLASDEVNIVGSTTVLPIAQVCAEVFMEKHPSVYISVGGGGSSIGAKALLAGTCDIADCSRPLKDKEMLAAIEKGITPKPHVAAMDGIAVILHPSNRIKAMSLADIKAIYTGEISNWSQIGGEPGEIVVISRDSSSGTFEAFNKLALKKARVRPDALLQASNKAVVTTVSQTPGAIGYIGMGYLNKSVMAVTVDGVAATKETVLSKTYPIARPLYMYTNGEPQGVVKDFLDFVKSKEGQTLAESEGFIGLN